MTEMMPCGCTRHHPQQCPLGAPLSTLPVGVYCAAAGPTDTTSRLAEEGLKVEKADPFANTAMRPWEYVPSTEHHGPYVTNAVGNTICDFYTMTQPGEASTLNGGPSRPVHFLHEMADSNAALVVAAVAAFDPDREQRVAELRDAVRRLLIMNPVFRSKPIGAPNSIARAEQHDLIEVEDEVRALLAAFPEEPKP